MKFIVFTLAFVCLAQNGFGAPSQTGTADTPNLEILMNNFNAAMFEANENIFSEEAMKNTKETINQIAGEVKKFIDEVDKISKELEPESKVVVKKFQNSINERLAQLKKDNPDMIAEVQQRLEEFVKRVVDELRKIGNSLMNNYIIADLEKLAKETP